MKNKNAQLRLWIEPRRRRTRGQMRSIVRRRRARRRGRPAVRRLGRRVAEKPIVAGTSAGAVVLWTLPSSDDVFFTKRRRRGRRLRAPYAPRDADRVDGMPAALGALAPLGFSAESLSVSKERDSSFLVIAGGHGMHAPAVFDTRDPFSTCAGSRVSSFGGTTRRRASRWRRTECFSPPRDDGASTRTTLRRAHAPAAARQRGARRAARAGARRGVFRERDSDVRVHGE